MNVRHILGISNGKDGVVLSIYNGQYDFVVQDMSFMVINSH